MSFLQASKQFSSRYIATHILTRHIIELDPDDPLVRDLWDKPEALLAIDPDPDDFEGWQLLPPDVEQLSKIIRVIRKLRGPGNRRSHPFDVLHAHQNGDDRFYALVVRIQGFVGACQLKQLGNWSR